MENVNGNYYTKNGEEEEEEEGGRPVEKPIYYWPSCPVVLHDQGP